MKKKWRYTKNSFTEAITSIFQIYSVSYLLIISSVVFLSIFLLDYYNLPSKLLTVVPLEVCLIAGFTVAVLIVTKLIQLHFFTLFRIHSVNLLDAAFSVVIIASMLYAVVKCSIMGYSPCIWIVVGSGIASLILLIARIMQRYNALKTNRLSEHRLIDLQDLYNDQFTHQSGTPVLLNERDVDYDLFGRSQIINRLYHTIQNCEADQSYVVSVEGKWGSGKTTIINNVKRLLRTNDKNVEIIDDFDPWIYGNQESLLLAMLETLMKNTGIKYSPYLKQKQLQKTLKAIVDAHPAGGLLINLMSGRSEQENIKTLKETISSYLKIGSKRVVFFIDNLDRTNDCNIVFLFKLISAVFDFPGIVYVLSYERDRIDKVLERTSEYDSRFTEKIIQQVISVPEVDRATTEHVYATCLINVLAAYGISICDM